MAEFVPIALVLTEFAVKIVLAAVILLRSRATPAIRLAWLVVVFAVPVVGVIAYLLIGEVRLGRRRVRCSRALT